MLLLVLLTQTQHVVESTGVLNNHETYLYFFCKDRYTDTQTGTPVEVPPVLKNYSKHIIHLIKESE